MDDSSAAADRRVRLAAFDWLRAKIDVHGEVLPWDILKKGFLLHGERVPLVGPQGIFKPRLCPRVPLSITTSPDSPYGDHFTSGGLLRYAYRGKDPYHRDNVGLRMAMTGEIPLVYFHGVVKSRYLAAWPVYVVGDDPGALTFTVALDDAQFVSDGFHRAAGQEVAVASEARQAYVTGTFRRRLHQRVFRERVLAAYRQQCAFCRLRHEELLDAAHIIGDTEEGGEPVVPNGLALCKLHHAAFDRYFLAVRPDYVIEVRPDILKEEDGPMLLHGLKGIHLQRIVLPGHKPYCPDPRRLEARYERFREAL